MIGADDFLQYVVSLGGSDERSGGLVMHGDVFLDSGIEFGDAAEHAMAQTACGDVAEEALDHVQPRSRGRRKVHCKARVFLQPFFHLGMFVRGVVIADQVQRLVFWGFPVNLAQEIKPFGMMATLPAAGDDRSVQDVECSEQGSCAIALVIVSHDGSACVIHRHCFN